MDTPKTLVKIFLPLVILAVGGFGGWQLFKAKQSVQKSRPKFRPPLVETRVLEKVTHPVTLKVMGTVKPERSLSLKPEVSGRVMTLAAAFTPGGRFKKNETLVTLDPADFELVVRKRSALVARARAALALEMGKQEVAREDLAVMEATTGRRISDTSLALRQPQLAQAQADLESARTDLDQARLDLKRTRIRAPFNALVLSRQAELGARVSSSETLAVLVGTDHAWVEAAVPVDRLDRIQFPGPDNSTGSRVMLTTAAGTRREGVVLRLKGEVNPATRTATVIVQVPDPFGLAPGRAPLLMESYVQVSIQARALEDTVVIPRAAYRNGGEVWLFKENRLERRRVTPVLSDADYVYVGQGLEGGELLIVSDLATPVDGMALRREGESQGKGGGQKKQTPPKSGKKE